MSKPFFFQRKSLSQEEKKDSKFFPFRTDPFSEGTGCAGKQTGSPGNHQKLSLAKNDGNLSHLKTCWDLLKFLWGHILTPIYFEIIFRLVILSGE